MCSALMPACLWSSDPPAWLCLVFVALVGFGLAWPGWLELPSFSASSSHGLGFRLRSDPGDNVTFRSDWH